MLVATLLSWSDARQACQALGDGWDRGSIRTEQVNQFLAGLLSSETWIGATDLDTEGNWVWASDGQPFWRGNGATGSAVNGAYVNWNGTEPNGGKSDCARVVPALATTWADVECSALRSSVCEGPAG